jgi:hypothetical protein
MEDEEEAESIQLGQGRFSSFVRLSVSYFGLPELSLPSPLDRHWPDLGADAAPLRHSVAHVARQYGVRMPNKGLI